MPEKTLEQKTVDDAAKVAADKAAADKKVADDAAAAKAIADKKAADDAAGNGDETVTIPKKRLTQLETDLDNYRTGLIGKKKEERQLDGQKDGGDTGKTGNVLDEKKIEEIATKATMASVHKRNEKGAIARFLKTHSEYIDDNQWAQLLPHLPGNINKDDELGILDAMEGAVLLHKRSTGKLDEYLAAQTETAKRQAEIEAQVNLGRGAGGIGTKSNDGDRSDKVPESTVTMGKKFGHDEAKLAESLKEIGKNPEGAYEINVMTPKRSKK